MKEQFDRLIDTTERIHQNVESLKTWQTWIIAGFSVLSVVVGFVLNHPAMIAKLLGGS